MYIHVIIIILYCCYAAVIITIVLIAEYFEVPAFIEGTMSGNRGRYIHYTI